MLHELAQNDFHLSKVLIDESVQLEARAVVYGKAPGRIFVDDVTNPKMGLIWLGNNDGFIFIGDENIPDLAKRINTLIDNYIIEEAKKVDVYYFEAIGCHARWNKILEQMFSSRDVKGWLQYVYTLEPDSTPTIPFTINRVNSNEQIVTLESVLYQSSESYLSITNINEIQQCILEFWSSIDDYLLNGIGYGVIVENELVSLCFSAFVLNKEHAVNIETRDSFMRNGYALALAEMYASECIRRDKIVYWDCMASNLGSVAIAERIGCNRVSSYNGYYFKL